MERLAANHVGPKSKADTFPRRGRSHSQVSDLGGNVRRQTIYDKPAQVLKVLGHFTPTSTR